MMIFQLPIFGAPSGVGALRTARSSRYGSGGTDHRCGFVMILIGTSSSIEPVQSFNQNEFA